MCVSDRLDCCNIDESSYFRELLALSFVSVNKKTKLFVSRIWDNNDNLYFCMGIHCSFINASFMRLLIGKIGKWLSDCGKQETRDPGAIFILHLVFLSLHLFPFVRSKSSSLGWQSPMGYPQARSLQWICAGSASWQWNILQDVCWNRRCASCAAVVLWVGFVLRGFRQSCLNIGIEVRRSWCRALGPSV